MVGLTAIKHIYIEDGVRNSPISTKIVKSMPWAHVIPIRDYREVFNRYGQSFAAQKRSQKLVVGRKEGRFLYEGTERIAGGQSGLIHYVDPVRNCLFDCDYCFLQGMHASANVLIHPNLDDYFAAAKKRLETGPTYVSLSYLTDILAFEELLGFCGKWMELASAHTNLTLEIRTKSEAFPAVARAPVSSNVIFAWSLTPAPFAGNHEVGTAGLHTRIFHAYQAARQGRRVRLCFDPVIIDDGWEEAYSSTVEAVFKRLDAQMIEEISVGVFRVHKEHARRMRKVRPDASILYGDYRLDGQVVAPPAPVRGHVEAYLRGLLADHMPESRVRFIHG